MQAITIKSKEKCRWDLVALGEVMLRLDPGDVRITTAREFRAWEGGGEYNVARGLRRCFGMDTSVVTALADNPVGRLVEGFIREGGVSQNTFGGPNMTVWGALHAMVSISLSEALGFERRLVVLIVATPLFLNSKPARLIGRRSLVARGQDGFTPAASSARFPTRPR